MRAEQHFPVRPRLFGLTAVLLVLLSTVSTLSGCSMFGGGEPTALEVTPEPAKGVTAEEQSILDVAYADRSQAQKLDLLLPRRTGEAVPLVIAIHGGGWQLGDKRETEGLVGPLRENGYAVASINYRLSDEAAFPAAVLDAKAAVRWLRAHAEQYGIDPNEFAAWGFSAGGDLAALIGVTAGSTKTSDPLFLDPALGNADVPGSVQAVVDFYGPSDLLKMDDQFAADRHCKGIPARHDSIDSSESLWLGAKLSDASDRAKAASPVHYLDSATKVPPFYLAHGLDDCTVPDRQSTELAQGLRKHGVRAELTIVPGYGHADPRFDELETPSGIRFLNSVFRRGAGSGGS